ncbi:hypothetical protein GCK32_006135 [Trichostrongylus colubriformis]|uniref:BEN domain-containing protein n=1 Tax=Trichostrongylus colubriformis TaxID=6319 RepID=A0AAN8EVG8_TRICO
MWLLVYCNESKTYSVISSADLPDSELGIGAVVNVVQSAEVVFMSPNRAICERQCGVLKKTPSLFKPCGSRPKLLHSESVKKDVIESKLDRIIAYLTSFELRLQKLADRQLRMERDLSTLTGSSPGGDRPAPPPLSTAPPKLDVRDRSPAPPRVQKTLTYPYRVTRDTVDDFYRTKRSATAFARAIERELFFDDADRDVNLDKRANQGKVRWLRDLVREWYPSPTFSAEASLWSACQIAINDYHRKKRKASGSLTTVHDSALERPSASDSPEWLEPPPPKYSRSDNDSPQVCRITPNTDFDDMKVYATDLL